MNDWKVAPMLGVLNVTAAVDFFATKLGFTRPERLYGEPGGQPVYGIVSRAGVSVHLQLRHGAVFPGPRTEHDGDAYFLVADIDALATEFAAKGVKFLRGVQDEPYGIRDFTIEIPEGHRLTFGTPLP